MKCFTITKDSCTEGIIITDDIPVTKKLLAASKDNLMTNASVILSTKERDDIAFDSVIAKDLHRASAVFKVVFDVPSSDVESGDQRVLIAYNPSEMFLAISSGDMSKIIFRSKNLFIALCNEGKTIIKEIKPIKKMQLEVIKDGPVFKEIPIKTYELPDEDDSSNFILEIQ